MKKSETNKSVVKDTNFSNWKIYIEKRISKGLPLDVPSRK